PGAAALPISPDGKRLASGSWDRPVGIWEAAGGRELRTLKGHGGGVTAITFTPDGNRLVSGSQDRTVKVWDATRSRPVRALPAHTIGVSSVATSPDGLWIASGGTWDSTVRLWNARSGQEASPD